MTEFFTYLTKAVGDNVPVVLAFGLLGFAVLVGLVLVLNPKWLDNQPPVDDEDGDR